MEKNKVVRAKKAKSAKKVKAPKPPKQKKEKRSVRKEREKYEKILKKTHPEKILSLTAIGLAVAGTVLQAVIDHRDRKGKEGSETETEDGDPGSETENKDGDR